MKYKWLLFLIIPVSAFADDLIMSNITNGCSSSLNTDTILLATFTPNQYQCGSGYYVPANNDGCVMCPDVYDCNGGTFTFNEEYDQGNKFKVQVTENIRNGCKTDFLRALNNVANITATFIPNVHNCNPGYYLPAGVDECRQCLENYYCHGGQLTFNETTPQGLNPCPSDTPYSPAASTSIDQCYKVINLQWYLDENATIPLTVQPDAQKCIYGQKITLPDTNPTKPGYIFSGWRLRTTQPQEQ